MSAPVRLELSQPEAQALYQTAKHGVWLPMLQPNLRSALDKLQAAREAAEHRQVPPPEPPCHCGRGGYPEPCPRHDGDRLGS